MSHAYAQAAGAHLNSQGQSQIRRMRVVSFSYVSVCAFYFATVQCTVFVTANLVALIFV